MAKKLLVVKDSYAHIMSQFLCQNYEEVHFVDPRYFNNSVEEYIKQNTILQKHCFLIQCFKCYKLNQIIDFLV